MTIYRFRENRMSRRKKNLRAFLHSNPAPTVEEAWAAAWEGAQKHYHSKTIRELEAKLERLTKARMDDVLVVEDLQNKLERLKKIRSNVLALCAQEGNDGWPFDEVNLIATGEE